MATFCFPGYSHRVTLCCSWLRKTLLWRHNGGECVSNHQPHDCLLNRLFGRWSKKTSKLRVTGLCAGNSPEIGEFPAQMASNAENLSIWWRHHEDCRGFTCVGMERIYTLTSLVYSKPLDWFSFIPWVTTNHILTRDGDCILAITMRRVCCLTKTRKGRTGHISLCFEILNPENVDWMPHYRCDCDSHETSWVNHRPELNLEPPPTDSSAEYLQTVCGH